MATSANWEPEKFREKLRENLFRTYSGPWPEKHALTKGFVICEYMAIRQKEVRERELDVAAGANKSYFPASHYDDKEPKKVRRRVTEVLSKWRKVWSRCSTKERMEKAQAMFKEPLILD